MNERTNQPTCQLSVRVYLFLTQINSSVEHSQDSSFRKRKEVCLKLDHLDVMSLLDVPEIFAATHLTITDKLVISAKLSVSFMTFSNSSDRKKLKHRKEE